MNRREAEGIDQVEGNRKLWPSQTVHKYFIIPNNTKIFQVEIVMTNNRIKR